MSDLGLGELDAKKGQLIVWVSTAEYPGQYTPHECDGAEEVLAVIRDSYGASYKITRCLDAHFEAHMDRFFYAR